MANVAILLIALMAHTAFAAYNVAKYCSLVKTGTKFPSFDSCQTYYVCNPNGGYSVKSCSSVESFDKDSQSCKPSSTVKCYYGVQDPCGQTTGEAFIPDPKNCKGYYSCKNGIHTGTGLCPNGQMFNVDRCSWGGCTNEAGNAVVEIQNLCQIMQTNAFFGDFENCNAWHKCANDQMKNGTCANSLVFNTVNGMCLANDGTMCSRVQNPSVVPTEPCGQPEKNTLKGDQNICSVYYECDGNTWNKKTCKDPLYFDVNQKVCLARQTATPAEGCNRCQYAASTWVNAVDPDCKTYLTCKDGHKADTGSCGDDSYFSEYRQVCVQGGGDLATYRKTNGACYKDMNPPTPPPTTESSNAPSSNDPTTASPPTTVNGDDSSSKSPTENVTTAKPAEGGTDTSQEDGKTDTSKEEGKTDTSKEEGKTDTSQEAGKTDTSKEENKTDPSDNGSAPADKTPDDTKSKAK